MPFLRLEEFNDILWQAFDRTINVPEVTVGLRGGDLDPLEFGLDWLLDVSLHEVFVFALDTGAVILLLELFLGDWLPVLLDVLNILYLQEGVAIINLQFDSAGFILEVAGVVRILSRILLYECDDSRIPIEPNVQTDNMTKL